MIWQNPWAWLGIAAIAVPIIVHLLARQQAVRVRFPTLRFLPVSPITAVRRHRLTDLMLLAVRISIITAAVAALAQPYVVTAGRGRTASARLARAIVIDTSASMSRPSADGRLALDAARTMATTLEPRADSTTTIESERLSGGLAAAVPWLDRATGRREAVVISDFQRGTLTDADVRALPADVSVRLIKIDVPQTTSTAVGPATQVGGRAVLSQMTLAPDRTEVEWTLAAASAQGPMLRAFVAAADRPVVNAAIEAALATGVPAGPLSKRVGIVFPSAPERAAFVAGAHPIDFPWFGVIERLRRDPLVVAAAQAENGTATVAGDPANALVPVVTTPDGRVLVSAAMVAEIDGTATLLFFPATTNGLLPAALAVGVLRAVADPHPLDELEPETLAADTLRLWERPAGDVAVTNSTRRPPTGVSDGRWLWALALALLALETWMRRAKPSAIVVEPDHHARVA